ncbi:MAG: DUF805 domain-containing protein [Lachnospiraceae bacterium]|nr:DUF805 domain-containing protein [Lachnospiraceae bacterium]
MLRSYKKIWLDAFDLKGRMSRSVYLRALIVQVFAVTIPSWIAILLLSEVSEVIGYVGLLGLSFSFIPMLSATVRRLHDVGRSWKWLLLYYFTSFWLVGIILFLIHITDPCDEDNCYGPRLIEDKGHELSDEKQHEQDGQSMSIEASFVDERLTEQDVKNDRKKFWSSIGKLVLIHLIGGIAFTLFQELMWYVL